MANRRGAAWLLTGLGTLPVVVLTMFPDDRRAFVRCEVAWTLPTVGRVELLANVVLFVAPALFAAVATRRPLRVFVAASVLSVLVETVQALIPAIGRSCSTNDWLNNTIGAAIGVMLAVIALRLAGPIRHPERTREAIRDHRSRRGVLIATTTAGIVLAGTAAAAALGVVGGWETPWGENPDGAIEFTLPSGEDCEYRIGNVDTTSRERSDEPRAWLDAHTLDQVADVDATLTDMRAQGNTFVRDDGTEVKVGYGTPYYDANNEYVDAVTRGVNTAIAEQAEETGILQEGSSLGVESEVNCADGWEPSSTWLP